MKNYESNFILKNISNHCQKQKSCRIGKVEQGHKNLIYFLSQKVISWFVYIILFVISNYLIYLRPINREILRVKIQPATFFKSFLLSSAKVMLKEWEINCRKSAIYVPQIWSIGQYVPFLFACRHIYGNMIIFDGRWVFNIWLNSLLVSRLVLLFLILCHLF